MQQPVAFDIDFKENVTNSPPKKVLERLERNKTDLDKETLETKLAKAEEMRNQHLGNKRKVLQEKFVMKQQSVEEYNNTFNTRLEAKKQEQLAALASANEKKQMEINKIQ